MSRCQKRGEKCSFARLLPFSVRIFPGRASQYCRKICEYLRVTRRWFCPLHAVHDRTAKPAPQQVTARLLTVASLHPCGVVFGDIYRHQRLTLRQRAPVDFSYERHQRRAGSQINGTVSESCGNQNLLIVKDLPVSSFLTARQPPRDRRSRSCAVRSA